MWLARGVVKAESGWRLAQDPRTFAVAGAPFASSVFAQGACHSGYNTPRCPMTKEVATAPIKPLFEDDGAEFSFIGN